MMRSGIKLMADYQCWPLWHYGGSEVGDIDPGTLGLSTALQADLQRWADRFDAHLDLSDPAAVHWTPEEEGEFDREGRRLCTVLARELGSQFEVFFLISAWAVAFPFSSSISRHQTPLCAGDLGNPLSQPGWRIQTTAGDEPTDK